MRNSRFFNVIAKVLKKEIVLFSSFIFFFCGSDSFAAIIYWDPNGTTSVGGNGVWDSTSLQWSTSTSGLQVSSSLLVAWNTADAAGFCAGPASSVNQGTFYVTNNSALIIGGIFNGSKNPGPCNVNLVGVGSFVLPNGLIAAFNDGGTSPGGATSIYIPITGPGQLCVQSSGQLYLNATNTYTGGTALGYQAGPIAFSGILNFNNSGAFGTGPITMSGYCGGSGLAVESNLTVTITNAFIATNVSLNIVGSTGGLTFSGPWTVGATPNIGSGGSGNLLTISGKISGAGGFTKYNASTLVLSGANTYTGVTTVSNGVLSITADNNLGTSPGIPTFDLTLSGGTLNASNTFILNSNRLTLLTANSSIGVSAGKTLTYNGPISGSFALTKSGAGTLILGATNSYTGTTTITAGIVEADTLSASTLGTNTVTVQTSGTLSGSGFISGPVLASGTIAPGTAANGPAVLSLGNGLDLSSGGTFFWNLATNDTSGNFSAVSITGGNLKLGGASKLSINFSGTASAPSITNTFWQAPHLWTIVPLSGSAANSGATVFSTLINGSYSAGTFTNYIDGSGNIVLEYLPNFTVLNALYDLGHGLFGGENLGFTNTSGLVYFAWSSTNCSLAISNWALLGQLQEHSLAPGQPGMSRYSINVNPTVSPTYIIAGNINTGPYVVSPVPFTTLTTTDFSTFTVLSNNLPMSTSGQFVLPAPIILPGSTYAAGNFQIQFSALIGQNYSVQASRDLVLWTNLFSGTVANSPTSFVDSTATNYTTRFYRVSLP